MVADPVPADLVATNPAVVEQKDILPDETSLQAEKQLSLPANLGQEVQDDNMRAHHPDAAVLVQQTLETASDQSLPLPIINPPAADVSRHSAPSETDTPARVHGIDVSPMAGVSTGHSGLIGSPDLVILSPVSMQRHGFSTDLQVALDVNDQGAADGHTSTNQPQLAHEAASYFDRTTELQAPQSSVAQLNPEIPTSTEAPIVGGWPRIEPAATDIDLDKLQEQIDIENVDFIPLTHSQIIEDDDMYGPPDDQTIGMEIQHIEEIRSRMSSTEPQDVQHIQPIQSSAETTLENAHDGGLLHGSMTTLRDGMRSLDSQQDYTLPPTADVVAFQPYPTHFATHTAIEADYEGIANVRMDNVQPPSSPYRSNSSQVPFIDGARDTGNPNKQSADVTHASLTHDFNAVQPEYVPTSIPTGTLAGSIEPSLSADEIETETALQKEAAVTSQDIPLSDSPGHPHESTDTGLVPPLPVRIAEDPLNEPQSNVSGQILTPDATQTVGEHSGAGIFLDSNIRAQLPPTPADSQPPVSQIQQIIHSVDTEASENKQVESGTLQPTPMKNLRRSEYVEGIASPYFSPQTPEITPDNAVHSVKVPASVRMRLRSSSPADIPVDHLETERSTAMLTSTDEIANTSREVGILSDSQRGITTPLEYYANLSTLGEYYNRLIDVMAVCVTHSVSPERAKSGPKDHFTTIHLVDPSLQNSGISVTAQVFRPHKKALPTVGRGDVLLLHRFKVQTQAHKPMLLSTDESAWAVYTDIESSHKRPGHGTTIVGEPIVSGPPIEYGPSEREMATRLSEWWHTHGTAAQFEAPSQASSNELTNTAGAKRFKKPAPAPINVRRSPRRPQFSMSGDTNLSPVTPSLQPESPTWSLRSQASPQSPVSSRSLRSQASATEIQTDIITKQASTTPFSILRTTRAGGSRHQSAPTSPITEQPGRTMPLTINQTPRNFSSSNSVVSSATQTSSSSKKRRLERRSTSLVHELRDGTQWVDVEQEEVYSVTESENAGEDDGAIGEDDNGEPLLMSQKRQTQAENKESYEPEDPLSLDAVEEDNVPAPAPAPETTVASPTDKTKITTEMKKSPGRPRKQPRVTQDTPSKRKQGRTREIQPDPIPIMSPTKTKVATPLHSPVSEKDQSAAVIGTRPSGRTTRSQAASQRGAT